VAFVRRHASIARFLFIGSLNTLIDLTLYAIFANFIGIHPVISSILSTGITLCFSFFMNHYFVFRSSKHKRHTALQFVSITLFNVWLIQSSIIWFALHIFTPVIFFQHHHWTLNMFAKVCGVSVSLVLNYLGYRKIFRESRD
jgi:putative flippase GtrA